MTMHRAYYELFPNEGPFVIEGEEAHHALRTKRLQDGDILEILDGKGRIARARIVGTNRVGRGSWAMQVEIEDVVVHPEPSPSLAVFSGVPKGPRLDVLIEGLSQAGAAGWSPLMVKRSVVDPRPTKLERLSRVATESGKQCGRAWILAIGSAVDMAGAIAASGRSSVVLADVSGERYEPSGAASVTLMVGPEGGFEPGEIEAARSAGTQIARFGEHTMRIETAAIVAAGVILELERREAPKEPGLVSPKSSVSTVSSGSSAGRKDQ